MKLEIVINAITAVNGGAEICVTAEIRDGDNGNNNTQKEKLSLLPRQYSELKIKKGEISRERFDEIAYAARICSAYKKGLFLLGYGACSEKSLINKLKNKGFDHEISSEAVAMLSDEGYLNETDDSVREAEKCLSKLWGRKRIISHLYSKGYSDAAIHIALEYLEDIDFTENCKRLISRTYKRQFAECGTDRAKRAKLIAALERMGYSFFEIKEASATFAADSADDD